MFSILVICTGNTCRSPMAEAMLSEKIRQNALAGRVKVWSAGLFAQDGVRASAGALAAMKRRRLDLAGHRSRLLIPQDVEAADLILTMTVSQKQSLVGLAPQSAGKVYSLAEYAGEKADIIDPFGGSPEEYEACAAMIARLLDKAWQKIVYLAGKSE